MFELVFVVLALGFVVVVVISLVKRRCQPAPAPDPNRISLGLGHALVIKGTWLEYEHVYGMGFKVPLRAVQVATVEKEGWGKAALKVIGNGAELAKVSGLPESWAERAQAWILSRISGHDEGAVL